MSIRILAVFACSLLAGTVVSPAGLINVPADYPTIQAAIDAADSGDEIVVADGVWTGVGNRDLDFGGKAITVRSANGPEFCIINCESAGRGFWFRSGEGAQSVVDGFSITNGVAGADGERVGGGAIACTNGSAPTIMRCVMTLNESMNDGAGAIYCDASDPLIADCTIAQNVSNGGGGVHCIASSPVIARCSITENQAVGGTGGGISLAADSDPLIQDCVIAHNLATGGGGIRILNSAPTILSCEIGYNDASFGAGISAENGSPEIRNCPLIENHATAAGGGIYTIDSVGTRSWTARSIAIQRETGQ